MTHMQALGAVKRLLKDKVCNSYPFGLNTALLGRDNRPTLPAVWGGFHKKSIQAFITTGFL
jgi:hypothetical protein